MVTPYAIRLSSCLHQPEQNFRLLYVFIYIPRLAQYARTALLAGGAGRQPRHPASSPGQLVATSTIEEAAVLAVFIERAARCARQRSIWDAAPGVPIGPHGAAGRDQKKQQQQQHHQQLVRPLPSSLSGVLFIHAAPYVRFPERIFWGPNSNRPICDADHSGWSASG
jgi:hypothetical protein